MMIPASDSDESMISAHSKRAMVSTIPRIAPTRARTNRIRIHLIISVASPDYRIAATVVTTG